MVREEAARLVALMVAATAQGSRLDGKAVVAMIDAYASLLADLPYARCEAAVGVLLQNQPFIPAVSEIRAAVLELEQGPIRSGVDAWGEVLEAMKRKGAYRRPGVDFEFSDQVTHRAVQSLGWTELCLSEFSTADRARFIELYDHLAKQTRREEQAPMLAAAREQREARQVTAGSAVSRLLSLVPPVEEP